MEGGRPAMEAVFAAYDDLRVAASLLYEAAAPVRLQPGEGQPRALVCIDAPGHTLASDCPYTADRGDGASPGRGPLRAAAARLIAEADRLQAEVAARHAVVLGGVVPLRALGGWRVKRGGFGSYTLGCSLGDPLAVVTRDGDLVLRERGPSSADGAPEAAPGGSLSADALDALSRMTFRSRSIGSVSGEAGGGHILELLHVDGSPVYWAPPAVPSAIDERPLLRALIEVVSRRLYSLLWSRYGARIVEYDPAGMRFAIQAAGGSTLIEMKPTAVDGIVPHPLSRRILAAGISDGDDGVSTLFPI